MVAMAQGMVFEDGEGLVTELRIVLGGLEAEGREPRARAPALDGESLRRFQEPTAIAAPAERLGDPEDVHVEPAAPDLAEAPPEHLVVLIAQEHRHRVVLRVSRDGNVERVQAGPDVLPHLRRGVGLDADPHFIPTRAGWGS